MRFGINSFLFTSPFTTASCRLFPQFRKWGFDTVEIPVEGPGVTAVTVSSDALEATTMIVVSDIDIIVKSSRNELFVFAENLLTSQPAAGVSLLISDGSKVFAGSAGTPGGVSTGRP